MGNWLNRITFRTKILSALLMITLVLSGLSLLLVHFIKDVNQVSIDLRDQGVPSVIFLSQWEREIAAKKQLIEDVLSNDNCCNIVDRYQSIQFNEHEQLESLTMPEHLRSLSRELHLLDFLILNELQGFINFNDTESAKQFLEEVYLEELNGIQNKIGQYQVENYDELQNKSFEFTNIIETALALLTIVTIIVVILSIYISYRISNGLTSPIELLIKKVNQIAYGQYGLTFENKDQQVELEDLTHSINRMSLKLKESFETIINDKQYREQIVNSLPIGMITIDYETSELALNSAAHCLLGKEAQRLTNMLAIPKSSQNEEFWDILISEQLCHNVKVPYKQDGKKLFFLVSQSILRDVGGRVIGRIFQFTDITETENLEHRIHQSEKLALVGEMAAGAAHEIRNPLAVIHGFLLLMNQSLDEEEKTKYRMSLLMKELDRINFIIEEMLLLAKPSAPQFKSCYLEEVVNDIIPLINQSPDSEQIDIIVQLDSIPIAMDVKQMKQVFYNLIRNSSEAMEYNGKIQIYSKVGEYYEVYISDSGSGIPKERQADIFEPFSTSKDSGTGLGLTIVKRIIQNHYGDIELWSSTEKGTTFRIRLPLKEG